MELDLYFSTPEFLESDSVSKTWTGHRIFKLSIFSLNPYILERYSVGWIKILSCVDSRLSVIYLLIWLTLRIV